MKRNMQTVALVIAATAILALLGVIQSETAKAITPPGLQRSGATQHAPIAIFPGDGIDGPALSYEDNGDGTITDLNTGLMWEKKTGTLGAPVNCETTACPDPHDVNNRYAWSGGSPGEPSVPQCVLDVLPAHFLPDGGAFTDFLHKLNNTCDEDEDTTCTSDRDCAGIGNELCGHAGFRDWRLPNVKELMSIVDYSRYTGDDMGSFASIDPIFGPTAAGSSYSSSTTFANIRQVAWFVNFNLGPMFGANKSELHRVRAVRGGG